MFKAIVISSVSVLLLTLASAAGAAPIDAELASNRAAVCHSTALTNYAIAVAIGAPDADQVIEDTMADCEQDYSYREAMAIADSLLSCGIDNVGNDRWVVVQECDCPDEGDAHGCDPMGQAEAVRAADSMLAGPLALLK